MKSQIGNNVKQVIKSKGLRQNYVAEKAGYNPKVFSGMLCGRQGIKDIDIIKIANVLNVTPNELFGIDETRAS